MTRDAVAEDSGLLLGLGWKKGWIGDERVGDMVDIFNLLFERLRS